MTQGLHAAPAKALHIRPMDDQPVAVIETMGDPAEIGTTIIQALDHVVAWLDVCGLPVPSRHIRARWTVPQPADRTEWITRWAVPIPSGTIALPPSMDGYILRRELWKYGTVAEAVHAGPYEELASTDSALRAAIAHSAYAISGDHEEEYRTPQGATEPHTIIRYCVEPCAEE